MSLFTPSGLILFSVGKLNITLGALQYGLKKSAVLVGMVFASQSIVNKNLSIPGKAGRFISGIFTIADSLMEQKISIKKGNVIKSLDSALIELWNRYGE